MSRVDCGKRQALSVGMYKSLELEKLSGCRAYAGSGPLAWQGPASPDIVETRPNSVLLLLPWTCLWLISLQILKELIKGGPCYCLTGTCLLLICSSGFSEPCHFPTNY